MLHGLVALHDPAGLRLDCAAGRAECRNKVRGHLVCCASCRCLVA